MTQKAHWADLFAKENTEDSKIPSLQPFIMQNGVLQTRFVFNHSDKDLIHAILPHAITVHFSLKLVVNVAIDCLTVALSLAYLIIQSWGISVNLEIGEGACMLIVLSQKIDTDSAYSDEVFET